MKRIVFLVWIAILFCILPETAVLAANLLQNPGFEEQDDGWPLFWEQESWLYEEDARVLAVEQGGHGGGFGARIENKLSNDSRFIQEVEVEPGALYRLGVWVKARALDKQKGGAGISINGYAADFLRVYDTAGQWQYVENFVRTAPGQQAMEVAVRLGFYHADTVGSALFDDAVLEKVDALPPGAAAVDLQGAPFIGQAEDAANQPAEKPNRLTALLVAGGVIVLLAAALMLLRRRNERRWQPQRDAQRLAALQGRTPGLGLSGQDWLWMAALTLLYACFAFYALGDAKAPQSEWVNPRAGQKSQGDAQSGQGQRETVFDLGQARTFTILYYPTLNLDKRTLAWETSADGRQWSPEHLSPLAQNRMFEWIYVTQPTYKADGELDGWESQPIELNGRYVRLRVPEGGAAIGEVAFTAPGGGRIVPITPAASSAATGKEDPARLVDEQALVPAVPSYLNGMYFDEIYHARTGYEMAHSLNAYEWTHPPLGKILIMLCIQWLGMTPFAWRLAGTLAGVAMVPLFYLFGKTLFGQTRWAILAAFLLVFDNMHLGQTRIATIDSFAVLFILGMYWGMVRYLQMSFFRDGWKTLLPLGFSGLMMGLACATKWTGFYGAVGLAVLFFWSLWQRRGEYRAAKAAGGEAAAQTAGFPKYVWGTLAFCIVFFIVISFAIYYLSYIPHLRSEGKVTWARFLSLQQQMFNYHAKLTEPHAYQSPWYEWPLMLRPIYYYHGKYAPPGQVATIMGMGNPLVWWAGVLGFLYVLFVWLRQQLRGTEKPDHVPAILLIGALAQFGPWIPISRATFIYHYFATLIFVMLCLVYALRTWRQKHPGLVDVVQPAYMVLTAAAFIGFYPLVTGIEIPRAWAEGMDWLKSLYLPGWKFGGWLRY